MTLSYLADSAHHLHTIAEWHVREWPDAYRGGDLQTAVAELRRSLNYDHLPVTLVATTAPSSNELLGAISLVERDLPTRPNLTPWMTTLYVVPECRGHGVARTLLAEGMRCLAKMGWRQVYVWIDKNVAVYERWDWTLHETIRYRGKLAYVMKADLSAHVP